MNSTTKRNTLIIFLALASSALAQSTALRLQLERTHDFKAAQPLSDRNGEVWAWRNVEGITYFSHTTSSQSVAGAFLKHVLSANGEALLTLEKNAHNKDSRNASGLVLRRFNREGAALGVHELAWHEDDPLPQIILNNSGTHALIVEPGSGRATLLAQSAQTFLLFENAPYTNERPVMLAASDSRFYVFTQFAPSTMQQTHAPTLIGFALTGKEEWRRTLAPGTVGALALSPSGKWLVAHRYQVNGNKVEATTTMLTADGREQITFPGLFRAAAFSQDEQFLFLLDRRELRCVNVNTGAILWRNQLRSREEMYVALTTAEPHASCVALIAVSSFAEKRFVYKKARLAAFAANGTTINETQIAAPLHAPLLLVHTKQNLLLAAEGQLLRYKIANASPSRLE